MPKFEFLDCSLYHVRLSAGYLCHKPSLESFGFSGGILVVINTNVLLLWIAFLDWGGS